ncbi:hypothetical protein C0J52_25711 [Blattella germanica]|nr:hypothetical protein C0J52_25711 [Blattella germanica]
MEDINTELLITLVKERPAIWDKTLDLYKDKKLKELSWREICVKLNEDFEDMDSWQKHEYGKL